MKYVIIAGTNRPGSRTLCMALFYREALKIKGIDAEIMALEGLDLNYKSDSLKAMEQQLLIPADKMIFIVPEYNGSYPGALKTVIDMLDYRRVWAGKKALLTGIATGRAGNLRGLDHLNGSLQYLQVFVHPQKLPISMVDKLMDEQGRLIDLPTQQAISAQLDQFISF